MIHPKKKSTRSFKQSLGHFIINSNLLTMMLAVFIGNQLGNFLESLITDIILPLLNNTLQRIKGGDPKKLSMNVKKWKVNFLGSDIHYGSTIAKFLNLIVCIFIAYLFVHYFVKKIFNM